MSRRFVTVGFAAALCLSSLLESTWAIDVPFVKHPIDSSFGEAASVFAADIDGDGDIDILGAAEGDDDITWWENPGGTATTSGVPWTEHTIEGSFDGAHSVFAADVDGDGNIDILGAALDADDIAWWENPGGAATTDGTVWVEHTIDGSFDGSGVLYSGGRSVSAADIDGDGDIDILGAAYGHDHVTWWENPGGAATTDGTSWTEYELEGAYAFGAFSVSAADIDGDGNTDVLGTNVATTSQITWWKNPGGSDTTDPSAWTAHTFSALTGEAIAAYASDIDGDGDTDIVRADSPGGRVTWWENPGGEDTTDGSLWTEHTLTNSFRAAQAVFAKDVDGDGDTDILGVAFFDNDVAWWENPGGAATTDGTPWTEHTVDGSFDAATSVYATDVDGDGDIDILSAAYRGDDIAWWENRTIHRNAVFPVEHVIDGDFPGAISAYAADIDGDGDADVVGAAAILGVAWWENTAGGGTAWTEHTVDGELLFPFSLYSADMDNDGDFDILGAALFGDDNVLWWENTLGDGTIWVRHPVDGDFYGAASVHAADMDNDGDLDILGAAGDANDITWWENMAGDGTTWSEHTVESHFVGAQSVYAADMDDDGDFDILGAAKFADYIAWWENTAGDATAWTAHTVDGAFDAAVSVFAADIDGDGDLDVLGAAQVADDIAWWENTVGDGTVWTEHTVDGDFNGAFSVYATDVDSDGDLDILGAAAGADDIVWWENTAGSGAAWTKHTIDSDFDFASSVFAADIDNDGDLDVLGAAQLANHIPWWENRGGQFGLPTSPLVSAETTSPGEQVVLQIDGAHNGRARDTDVELVTFELLFDDGATPLTDAQANSIIENLYVYLDDGSGDFDPADTLVDTVSSLSLTNGVQEFTFADGNTDAQVMHGASRRYFVVLDLLAGGLLDLVRVTHLTESSSQAEDRDHDIPLKIEFSSNVSATTIVLQGEGACPAEVVRANMTLTGTQALQASVGATLGSNLVVDGDDISVVAPVVSIVGGTSISGPFSIGTSPACP